MSFFLSIRFFIRQSMKISIIKYANIKKEFLMRSNVSGSEGKIQFFFSKYSHSHILKIRASIKIIRKPEPILIYKAPKERTSLSFVRKYKMINKEFYPHLFCRKLRCKKIFYCYIMLGCIF